jgi:hypothetical protein
MILQTVNTSLSYFKFTRDTHYLVISDDNEFVVLDSVSLEEKCRNRQFGGLRFLSSHGLSNMFLIVSSGSLMGRVYYFVIIYSFVYLFPDMFTFFEFSN